jgi:hypothetical protein
MSPKTTILPRILLSLCLLLHGQLFAGVINLPSDTRVYVETTEHLLAKGDQVKEGQPVNARVWRDIVVNGHVLIAAGTPVEAKVDFVKKRQIAGVKGQMTLGAYETRSTDGQTIQLSGGYHKDGKSRMALSITLGVLFILPIFIPGKAAELPTGTVFDAYVDRNWDVDVRDAKPVQTVDLSYLSSDIEAELLYDKLAAEEKPKYFEFQITVPSGAPREFVIDRVNTEEIDPLKLKNLSESVDDDESIITAQIKIKTLVKKFAKGINSIEISSLDGDERVSTKLIIDIEI